jgi:hypothetical protein
MPDMSAQPPVGSGGRHPRADASMAKDRQVAFWAIGLMLDSNSRYRQHLGAYIAPHPVLHQGNAKALKCHLARLAEPDALGLLGYVWSHCYCRKKKFANIRANGARIITRHCLGKALEASGGAGAGVHGWPKFLRRASRIVEAAITYGLLVEEKAGAGCAPGCKPLWGTKKLDQLMIDLGIDFGAKVHKSILYDGKKLSAPPHGKKRKGA